MFGFFFLQLSHAQPIATMSNVAHPALQPVPVCLFHSLVPSTARKGASVMMGYCSVEINVFPLRVVAVFMKAATDRVESSSGLGNSANSIVSVMGCPVLSTVIHHLVSSRKYAVPLKENMAVILDPVPHALLQGTPTTPLLMDIDLTSRAHAYIHWRLYVMILWDCHIFRSLHKMKHGMDAQCQSLLMFMSMFQDTWCTFHATCMALLR